MLEIKTNALFAADMISHLVQKNVTSAPATMNAANMTTPYLVFDR